VKLAYIHTKHLTAACLLLRLPGLVGLPRRTAVLPYRLPPGARGRAWTHNVIAWEGGGEGAVPLAWRLPACLPLGLEVPP